MSTRSDQVPDLSSISGELRVLKNTVFLMIVFAALNFAAVLRLFGVPGLVPLLLIFYRIMDALIIASFLIYCGSKVKVRPIDLLLFSFATYPFLIGLARGNLSVTFLNDTTIFFSFLAKIIVFRTVLSRIAAVIAIDVVFRDLAQKIVWWCGLIALVSLTTALVMLAGGVSFYYQAPAELTFAAALVLAQGKIYAYLFLLLVALAAGKRMVMVGLLAMGVVAALTNPKILAAILRFSIFGLILLPFGFMLAATVFDADIIFIDKILGTVRQLERAMNNSVNFLEALMFLDPARYAEYVSLSPHLTGWSLWFGNGFGFRYELDASFLAEFGYSISPTVTNAHFTPLAITAKFGLIGVGVWIFLIVSVLASGYDRRSFVQLACRLAFISMIVQSLFAFGFFINLFTPFYIAMASVRRRRSPLKSAVLRVAKQQKGFT